MGAGGIALPLPGGGFGDEAGVAVDAAVETLAGEDADLDLDHIEPTRMLGDVVKLDAAKYPSRLSCLKGLVERAGRMGRQIVEDHPDTLGLGIIDVGELARAGREVLRGAPLGR